MIIFYDDNIYIYVCMYVTNTYFMYINIFYVLF